MSNSYPTPERFEPTADEMSAAAQRLIQGTGLKYQIEQIKVLRDQLGIHTVAVLWRDGDAYRATYADRQEKAGYVQLKADSELTEQLFQQVAGYGLYLSAEQKKKLFPDITNWSR